MKIILVDDQTLIRKGIGSILSKQGMVQIAGEAKNKKEAVLLIQKEVPDLVLLDFYFNKECSVEVITEVRQLGIDCKFTMLMDAKDTLSFEVAIALDVEGYISLDAHPEELLYAMQVIKRGKKYYDPIIIDFIMQSRSIPILDDHRLSLLTAKEKEILQKLGIGFTNKQIAGSLFITENTVKKHVSQVLAKLELADRTQAALYANVTGLVQYNYEIPI